MVEFETIVECLVSERHLYGALEHQILSRLPSEEVSGVALAAFELLVFRRLSRRLFD